jgi:hypothetical protein
MKAPKQGSGLHDFLLRESRDLLMQGHSVENTVRMLVEGAKDSNRTTQNLEEEITNAVLGAKAFLDANPNWRINQRQTTTEWIDPYLFEGLDDRMVRKDRRSPTLPRDDKLRAEAIAKGPYIALRGAEEFSYHRLFCGLNFRIAACIDMAHKATVKFLNEWKPNKTFPKLQYITPSYYYWTTAEGGDKSDFNVGERLYCVIEFDDGHWREQRALLAYLERRYRSNGFVLFMIVDSGGKSLHGWFTAYGISEYKLCTFCRAAKQLGADKTTFSPSQWVRMPNGWNVAKQRRQQILFFDRVALDTQTAMVMEECGKS